MNILTELKRRNVVRMAGLYLVGAWLLVQVAGTLLPVFDAPAWVMKTLVGLLAVGLVPALIFSWAFELTPAGLKRDEDVRPEESIAPQTARRMDRMIIAVLVLALCYFAFDKFVLASRRAAVPNGSSSEVSAKSIAVLPFENLSAEKQNAYFAEGIQDEILTGLAKIGDLKVISRTSTLRYSSRPENLPAIARQLGVAHILEGSVQRASNKVRVNVQLIEAANDNHLWAETYDRTLEDVFAVESEVAQKIAASLQARLTGDERAALTTRPTDSPEAYEAYLKARTLLLRPSYDRGNSDHIIEALRTAVKLDPNFALGWAELAGELVWGYWGGFDASPARLAMAKSALDQAETLQPDLPEVVRARAQYLYYGERNFSAALTATQKARRLLPNNADVWHLSALLERRLGQFDAALTDFEHARTLNPNGVPTITELGLTLFLLRRFQEAEPVLDAGLSLQRDDETLLTLRLYCAWNLGGIARGGQVLAAVRSDAPPIVALRAQEAFMRRDYATASALYGQAIATGNASQTPFSFSGYIPANVEWRLQMALCEQRNGSAARAIELYRKVQTQAQAALSEKLENRNVEAAWHAALGWADAGLDQREQSIAEAQRATALIPETSDTLEGPGWQASLAMTYGLNRDADHAVPLIQHLLRTKISVLSPAILRIDPIWDGIRDDPRFQQLLKEPAVVDNTTL